MRTLQAIFKNKKGTVDPNTVSSYYGHGAQTHQGHEHSNETNVVSESETRYGCPMRCEGDKTYDQPGNCPVCNMKLVPVGKN